MIVSQLAERIYYLQFLPDGERLFLCILIEGQVEYAIYHPFTEEKLVLHRSDIDGDRTSSYRFLPGYVAIPQTGDVCYLIAADDLLYAFRTSDGVRLNEPDVVTADQVVITSDGGWLVTLELNGFSLGSHVLRGIQIEPSGGDVLWEHHIGEWGWPALGGFLSGDEHFITVEYSGVQIRSFSDGNTVRQARFPANTIELARISPDRKVLGVAGYSSLYFYDTETLDRPKRITTAQSSGDFIAYAFHPSMQQLAVIYKGPTLVKMFDYPALKLTEKYAWKLGALQTVDFSPSGELAAAGSANGSIVVWDVEL